MGAALVALELEINAIFDHEGVHALFIKAESGRAGSAGVGKMLISLSAFGTKFYVAKEALDERGLDGKKLSPHFVNETSIVDRQDTVDLILNSDFTIEF